MKIKRMQTSESAGKPELAQASKEADDFHSRLISQELRIKTKRKSANKPVGNDEYEQMVAEDADFNTRKIIAEAAYFIAERRCFTPGQEVSDWLQAEINVEHLLRSAVIDRRKALTEDRRSETSAKL